MQTFSTGNSAVAALLMTLYPRLPTGPSDNRCHLQVHQIFCISFMYVCVCIFYFYNYLVYLIVAFIGFPTSVCNCC